MPDFQSQFDQFGLFGLLNIIRATDASGTALALGTDLTTLGLNLNCPDAMYTTFISPFADSQTSISSTTGTHIDPEYHLPSCYIIHPSTQLGSKGIASRLANLADETLFYMFYAQVRDFAQDLAAQELYARHWRFHKELQLWVTKDPVLEPVTKTAQYERGVFIFFDVARWEKTRREYTLWYSALEERGSINNGVVPPPGLANNSLLGSSSGGGNHPLLSAITGNVHQRVNLQQQQQQPHLFNAMPFSNPN